MIKLAPIAEAILREQARMERTKEGMTASGSPAQRTPQPEVAREVEEILNRRTAVIARRKDASVEFRLHKSNAARPVYAIVVLAPDVHLIHWALQCGGDAEATREFHQLVDRLAGPEWGKVGG